MDFSKEEVKAALEVLGQRYKILRAKPPEAAASADQKKKQQESIRALDRVIKQFLRYQKEHFPAEEVDEAEAESLEQETETLRDYSNFRLLLVDDDAGDRSKLRTLLEDQGFQHFDESDDGHNAIAQIKDKGKPYDLVLCDFNMPTISGLDVLKLIRQEQKYASMPFVMVSTKGHKKQFEEAVQAGVNGYIVKPITPENLLPKIDMLLQ